MRPDSFSCQRNAGMSQLVPSSSPAWLAPVWLERSHSQPISLWLPDSIQRAIVGACPSLIAARRTCSPRPSISNRITPGTSVRFSARAWRARLRTTRRLRASPSKSSSDTSVVETSASTAAISRSVPNAGALPVAHQNDSATTPALIASEARPNVISVSGNATRISTGQMKALTSEIASTTSTASPNPIRWTPPSTSLSATRTSASTPTRTSQRTSTPARCRVRARHVRPTARHRTRRR